MNGSDAASNSIRRTVLYSSTILTDRKTLSHLDLQGWQISQVRLINTWIWDLMQPYFHVIAKVLYLVMAPLVVGSISEALDKDPHNPLSFLPKLNTVFHITTKDESSHSTQADRTLKCGHKHRQDVFQLAKLVCSPLLNCLLLRGTSPMQTKHD